MLLKPDCIPCILKMIVSAMHSVSMAEASIEMLLKDMLTIPALKGADWELTSPEVIEAVWTKFVASIGDPDPFQKEKDETNARILTLHADLTGRIARAQDPVKTAVQLAIAGNAIDVMLTEGSSGRAERIIDNSLETSLDPDAFVVFKRQLEKSRVVLFFGDNAGEIVLDRLLIETLSNFFDLETHYVVRGMPTLNDATIREAKSVGLDGVTHLIENGVDGPLPGTILRRCSARVRDLVEESDLIISKGGGNFDTLDEERRRLKSITFMLLSKCQPYNTMFDTQLYKPVLANFFQPEGSSSP